MRSRMRRYRRGAVQHTREVLRGRDDHALDMLANVPEERGQLLTKDAADELRCARA